MPGAVREKSYIVHTGLANPVTFYVKSKMALLFEFVMT